MGLMLAVAWAGCGDSCAPPAAARPLVPAEIASLMEELAAHPAGQPSQALDTLLFHGPTVRTWLEAQPDRLPPSHKTWLQDELRRDTVEVRFRLVDDQGDTLAKGSHTLTLGHKAHISLGGDPSLGLPDVSGRVERVGAHHLWSRF